MSVNPLIEEAARGLTLDGRVHLDYFNYLLFQAVVLFMWWPKSTLPEVLARADRPDTLLAVAVICVITVGYYQIRAGAEEFLLPGQHGLREWAIATPLSVSRILAGHLVGVVLQLLHALALSSPLWMVAFAVCDTGFDGLALAFVATALLGVELRLGAAVIYLLAGHQGALCFIAVRGWLVLGLLLPAMLSPAMSYLRVVGGMLDGGPGETMGAGDTHLFFAGHVCLCLALMVVLHALLTRQRLSHE